MILRSPNLAGASMPLSRYVREELLTEDLMLDPVAMVAAHRSLVASQDDASIPFLTRRQRGSPRGKETGVGAERAVVFTDNSPAVWLHHRLLLATRQPAAPPEHLVDHLRARAVPAAQVYKRDERLRLPEWPLLHRCMGRTYPPIWTAGWKLSHILPCSPHRGGAPDPLAALELADPPEYFRVRALRNLSPFNYFLTPSPKRYAMFLDRRSPYRGDLGEDQRVIAWVVRVLRDEILSGHPEAREAFDAFLRDAGQGQARVVSSVQRPLATATRASRVFQVNQSVSGETYSGFLCAPDGNESGWARLREMQPGDVILHNAHGLIRAVSVVEPMDTDDVRLSGEAVDRIDRVVGACACYHGRHLSLPEHPATTYLTCLVTTPVTDLDLTRARPYQGYAVDVRRDVELRKRPDLVAVIERAVAAYQSVTDDDEQLVQG